MEKATSGCQTNCNAGTSHQQTNRIKVEKTSILSLNDVSCMILQYPVALFSISFLDTIHSFPPLKKVISLGIKKICSLVSPQINLFHQP
jgi:hypothetical protein